MIDFIVKNWRLIVELVLLLASIVLLIVKKKPLKLVDSVKTMIISYLPEVINRVEAYCKQRGFSSKDKLRMAVFIIQDYLVSNFGLTESELPLYTDFIIGHIESILSTPQKKEDK